MKLFAFALAFLQLARGQTLNGTWGYEVANATYGVNYFYWFFEPQVTPTSTTPLVLWLTGGPGCSSELALFFENGIDYLISRPLRRQ
jgi:hypothetical protein